MGELHPIHQFYSLDGVHSCLILVVDELYLGIAGIMHHDGGEEEENSNPHTPS
jgi:hypothetical protein